jgi:hypothetical protein
LLSNIHAGLIEALPLSNGLFRRYPMVMHQKKVIMEKSGSAWLPGIRQGEEVHMPINATHLTTR